jgi:hypothetical protein
VVMPTPSSPTSTSNRTAVDGVLDGSSARPSPHTATAPTATATANAAATAPATVSKPRRCAWGLRSFVSHARHLTMDRSDTGVTPSLNDAGGPDHDIHHLCTITIAVRNLAHGIFYGRSNRNFPPEEVPTEAWTASLEGVTVLLDECCAKLDDEAPLYNSAKHGLSAAPGNAAMQLGDPDAPVLSAIGPSITLLEAATDSQVGRKRWRQTTHWVSPDRRLALTYVVIQQIENLWTVARHRYLRMDGSSPLAPLPVDKIDQLLSPPLEADGPGFRITVETMGIGLLYEIDTPTIKQQLAAVGRRNRKRR